MEFVAQNISGMTIAGIIVSLLVGFGIPVVLFTVWRKKTGANVAAFLVGCCVFVVFVNILENAFHSVFLTVTGTALTDNVLLFALYGGLAAGLFEEFGRYIAMKAVMKKYIDKKNSVMYGIGHGGIEAVLLLGTASISNLVMSLMINAGKIDTILGPLEESVKQETFESISALWTTPAWMFFMGSIERISAVTLHICLSYVVYRAVRDSDIKWLFAAIATHFFVDAGTVLLTRNTDITVWAFELILLVLMAALAWHIIKIYLKDTDEAKEAQEIS